jgi:aspartyl-tRNA(Asn)/glutamyl-tRNA(Gln) amidotransferase subunit A
MNTIRKWSALLRAREISSVELVGEFFAQVRRESYGSLITELQDTAVRTAAERDDELARGFDRGPLHGIPTAPKDLFYTKGIRTTGGSLVFRDFVPTYDATVVRRLNEAGTVQVGKANLHEIAYGITSLNPHFGPVVNPRGRDRLAGGSSGGSGALVAAGLLPFSLGTDTGGSVRIPASYCGVVGLKPTYGRVTRFGVLPLSYSLDHVGVLAASVDDCALTLTAMAGHDPNDLTSSHRTFALNPAWDRTALKDLRVGVPKNFFFDSVDSAVSQRIHEVIDLLRREGARISEVSLPNITEMNAAARVVQFAESSAVYAHIEDAKLFSPTAWSLIQQGRLIAGHEYVNAQRLRTVYRREFDKLWRDIDFLIAPTTPVTAPRTDAQTVQVGTADPEDVRMASTRLVRAFNLLGEPAISLPCGSDDSGLPIGLQLIAAPFADAKLLGAASAIERVLA